MYGRNQRPCTLMYVYIGSAVGDVARALSEERTTTVGEKVLFWVGLAVTVAVTVFVTRIARRALGRHVELPAAEPVNGPA